jgi:KDO2-lipid IV(A) lauroyltransferase
MGREAKKNRIIQFIEYMAFYLVTLFTRFVPRGAVHTISGLLGNLLYLLVPRRRDIAINNLRNAFDGTKSEREVRELARQSCRAFFLTFLEIIKYRPVLTRRDAINWLKRTTSGLDEFMQKARSIHDESGGCIFVTPHIGNWEILPYVTAIAGVPLTVVARPLDNVYIERFLNRAASGQVVISKNNVLFTLQRTLRHGRSIGMLPDQSTMKGVSVDFFGQKALTTPVPAVLAISYKRPIVVIACCRKSRGHYYEVLISEPIWPGTYKSKKAEILRLTEAMNHTMESIIRRYPEQYLWIHNRWKTYRGKREFLG